MPTTITVPEHHVRHCEPCKWHKVVGAFYGHDHSWRAYDCMHPDADMEDWHKPMSDPAKEKLRLEFKAFMGEHGRHIGRTENQPNWCPLRKESK